MRGQQLHPSAFARISVGVAGCLWKPR